MISTDFPCFIKCSYNLHSSCNLHNSYNLHNQVNLVIKACKKQLKDFYIIFFVCIKMSAKCYQKNKEKLRKEARER